MNDSKIDRKVIANDWQQYCPELTKLRPLEFDNRVGPLVVGIYLQVIGDIIYRPVYRVENLYTDCSFLASTLEIEGRSMNMETHKLYSEQIAVQLHEKAYIPLQGEVTFENIKKGYEDYFKKPTNRGSIVEFEDYVFMCSWIRKNELFENALQTVYDELKTWPEERYFSETGGFKNWILELEKRASNYEELEKSYELKYEKYKIKKLLERKFIY